MIWDQKIHTVPPKTRLIPGAGFPAGIEDIRPYPEKVDRSNLRYLVPSLQNIIDLLYAWAPYIDSAYCVTAPYISDRSSRNKIIPLFDAPLEQVLRIADLLVIRHMDGARDEDVRFLRYVLAVRSDQKKITAIDSMERLTDKKEA